MSEQSTLFIDNAPFLGRIEEQQRFREALRQVLQANSIAAKAKKLVVDQDTPLPFVFLLYGEGGMGKSTLAKQLRHITTTESDFKGHFETLWLDWEARKQLDLKLVARESVSPETVFEHIYAIFRDANFGKEFDAYEKARTTRAEAEKKVAQALDATVGEGRDRYAGLRELGAIGLAWLVRSGIVGGTPLPVPQEPMAKVFEAILGGGADAIAHARETATTLLRSRLNPDEFDLFTLPNETLARKLADGIWKAAQKKPIILTLDTYEIADRADVWLRVVIKRAGPNIIWVVAGRDNLAESRKYGQGYQPGYGADFTSDRLRVFSMNEFSVSDVAEYFEYRVPERPLNDSTAQAIHQAALGIPLAVKEAAAIWQNPATTLNDITGTGTPSRNRDKIVQTMTQRFLMHCWDDPHDRRCLYALVLAYQPDADLLSAMLDTTDLEAELSELERRHSFVFVDDMRLHEKVSVWICEYLQAEVRRKSKEVRDLHQRAVNHLRERLTRAEAELVLIEDRCADDSWVMTTIGIAYHLFWLDEIEAWHWLIPRLVESLAYSRELQRGLLGVADGWKDCLSKVGQKRLKNLNALNTDDEADGLDELVDLTTRGYLKDDNETERHAILDLRRGKLLYHHKKYAEALACYDRAERDLPEMGEKLKEQLGEDLYELSYELMWPEGSRYAVYSPEAERILPKVVNWFPERQWSWYRFGIVLDYAERKQEAIVAFKHAIELDPVDPYAYIELGKIYRDLGHANEAIANYRHAIDLAPRNAYAHSCLGDVYRDLGHVAEAVVEYQRSIELDPKDTEPHKGLGIAYRSLGRTEDAVTEYQKAIKLDPKDAVLHNNLGTVYRDLGRTEDALTEYQKAIEFKPRDATLHINRGTAYRDLGHFEDALTEYQKAIELEPKIATPHIGRGIVFHFLRQYEEALSEYERAIELDPTNGPNRGRYASVLRKLGREPEANEQLKIGRETLSNESEYRQAYFEAICGDIDEALALLKVALEKKRVPLAWVRRDPDFENIRSDPRFIALVGVADEKPSADGSSG